MFYIHPAGLEEKCAERWAGWRRAQLSPCLPPSLALQAKTVLKVSKVLYLKSLTSKGRTLGEYVSSHYELVSSNKSSWHLLLDVRNKSPDSTEIKGKKSPNNQTPYTIPPSDLWVQDLLWENPVLRTHRAKPCFLSEWQTRKPHMIMLISHFKYPLHNCIPLLSVFRLKVIEFTNHLMKLHSLNPWQIMWTCLV